MFYSNSARAMWDPQVSKKFWKGTKLPRFRITINKAFEMVAVYGPNLFWEIPHRNVEGKRPLILPEELFGQDEQGQMMYQQMQQMQQGSETQDKIISYLMDRWLNYTPREQPGGGLSGHSHRSVVDSLIKGRGVAAIRPDKMPGSGRNLTGCFRVAPEDVFLDPDFDSVDECMWMAIKHVDVHTEVEKRFELPKNSLKDRSTLESSWQYGELASDDQSPGKRKNGTTNDLVTWYEIYSKAGCGCSTTSMDTTIRDHMDETVGQYAYLAICADVPYPLNMPPERLRKGASDEDVKEAFSWPVPFWADDRWPVEFLDYYTDPESNWPIAPMAPGLGELKLLNFLMSWFANRTWSSSRDFWAVSLPHLEHYKEYINNSEDQAIIPTPVGLKSPKEAIEILTQPEARQDMSKLISFVSDMFDRRVGLTATMYGQNEGGTQNRTAEETSAKERAVMARPEYMQKQVVDWESRKATSEAMVTRWFVTAQDVMPYLGQVGAMLWQQHIESTDVELVVRQFNYTVAASSIRRPNRERDVANFQQVMQLFAPTMQGYGESTGNFDPFNNMMEEWGKLHDANLDTLKLPSQEPDPEAKQAQAQMEQQAAQLQLGETQAKIEKLKADAQSTMIEAQMKPQELQLQQAEMQAKMQMEQAQVQAELQLEQVRLQGEMQKQQGEAQKLMLEQQMQQVEAQMEQAQAQMKLQAEQAKQQMQMMIDQAKAEAELQQDEASHIQDMLQDQQLHEQELAQKEEMIEVDLSAKKEQAKIAASQKKNVVSSSSSPSKKGK